MWPFTRTDGIDRKQPLETARYVVLDTELTSLNPRTSRMLSLGAVAMDGASIRLGQQFYDVVNPGVPVPAETIVVHRLRPIDVENGIAPADLLRRFHDFAARAVLVGHFVRIDVDALRRESNGTGLRFNLPAIDTMHVHQWLRRRASDPLAYDERERSDLLTVANYWKVPVIDLHQALDDAFLTARVWQRLLFALRSAGIETVGQALKVGKP